MNDLERDLRELLQRKADEGWAQPEAPVRVLRRVRRRQAATAAVAGVAAALVGLASFAGVRAVLDPDGEEQPAAPTTTRTLNGITIEYPEGWFLVDPRTLVGLEGQDGLILALSNHEATGETLGCPGLAEGTGTNRVLLTVNRNPSEVAVDAWPASLDPLEIEDTSDSRCYPGWEFLSARWTASGRSYGGVVGMGPDATTADREAIASAFASMAFVTGPSPDPTAAVIAEGTAAGEAWQLIVRSTDQDLQLELAYPNGGIVMSGPFEGDVPLEALTPLVLGDGPSAEVVAFGLISPEVAQVSVTVPGFAGPAAEILDIPDEIAPDLQAFVATVPVGEVTVRVRDAGGNILDEQTIDPTEVGSTSVPTALEQPEGDPPVEPEHGGTYWGVYVWLGPAGHREAEDVYQSLVDEGLPASIGELACDRGAARALDTGAEWRVAVYFDTEDDANRFALERGLIGHEARTIARVTTYCLD